MRIGLIAMSGVRVQNAELMAAGLTLPGFVERSKAIAELETYFRRGGRQPAQLKKLGKSLQEAGRTGDAVEALEELLWVWPMDEELHRDLGDWMLTEGREGEALREFRALLASGPLDKAGAHYRLAQTYHKMDDSRLTRRHLLQALEAAPGYRPAQKLLLEMKRN